MTINFKNYILSEKFEDYNVEAGDVLSALQQIKSDIDNIKRKDLISALEEIIIAMRSLLNSKSDPRLVYVIQKIICAIKDDIESNNDLKDTIESSVYELESYFKDKKVIINKPIKVSSNQKGVSKPVNNTPVKPKELINNIEVSPEEQASQFNPPLAGSGDKSTNIV